MSATRDIAPSIACAQVGGSGDFGRRASTTITTSPIEKQHVAQISRPAGCIHEKLQAEEAARGAGSECAPRAFGRSPISSRPWTLIATTLDEAWAHC